jgi:hypothetical protein
VPGAATATAQLSKAVLEMRTVTLHTSAAMAEQSRAVAAIGGQTQEVTSALQRTIAGLGEQAKGRARWRARWTTRASKRR